MSGVSTTPYPHTPKPCEPWLTGGLNSLDSGEWGRVEREQQCKHVCLPYWRWHGKPLFLVYKLQTSLYCNSDHQLLSGHCPVWLFWPQHNMKHSSLQLLSSVQNEYPWIFCQLHTRGRLEGPECPQVHHWFVQVPHLHISWHIGSVIEEYRSMQPSDDKKKYATRQLYRRHIVKSHLSQGTCSWMLGTHLRHFSHNWKCVLHVVKVSTHLGMLSLWYTTNLIKLTNREGIMYVEPLQYGEVI